MKTFTKREILKRVSWNGQQVPIKYINWDHIARTFSSVMTGLNIDFSDIHGVTINIGDDCTLNIGFNSVVKTGDECTLNTHIKSGFDSKTSCVIKTGSRCIINSYGQNTISVGHSCRLNINSNCTIIRRDVHEVISLTKPMYSDIVICPHLTPGYLIGETYYLDSVKQEGLYQIRHGKLRIKNECL